MSEHCFRGSECGAASRNLRLICSHPCHQTSALLPLSTDVHHEASCYWPCCAYSSQFSFCSLPTTAETLPCMVQCSCRAAPASASPPRNSRFSWPIIRKGAQQSSDLFRR